MFFDLDRMKAINDYLGHTAGDWFIKVLAERLRGVARGPNVIARLGGDEFVSSFRRRQWTQRRLKRWRIRFNRSCGSGLPLTVNCSRTTSIGVALGVPGRDTTSDLLRRADQAVLTAKGAGGNQIATFSDDMSLNSELRNDLELHLQNVIDTGALVLHYLPEVDMRTGEILATEALVRPLQHPTRGLSPDAFIGVAESINLAGELGRRVMRNACARVRQLAVAAWTTWSLRVVMSPSVGCRWFRRVGRRHY